MSSVLRAINDIKAGHPARYSIDAASLKVQVKTNLAYLRTIQSQAADQLSSWNIKQLSLVIASHEQQLAQLNKDLLINKII